MTIPKNEVHISFKDLIHFTPKQVQATEVADSHKYTLFGGSAGPGKSYWLRWNLVRILIKWGQEYNLTGIRGALFCEDYPTLKDRQISKMEVEFPMWLGQIKDTKTDGLAFYIAKEYGGHVLMLRNLDDPSKYLSSEFAIIGMEEVTQNEEMKFHRLRSRLLWTGIPEPKWIGATNPGGIGHEWVKRYFVDRDFPDYEKEQDKFAYVPALPTDNPYLAASYILTLQSLPEKLRQAYLEGRWDIFEGMFFTEWDPKVHIVEPFEIPDTWPRLRGIDPSGRSGTTSSHIYALSDDGTIYITHEHFRSGLDTDEHARLICKMSEGITPKYTVIDSAAFSKLGMPESQAEIFERYGVTDLIVADKHRIPGWNVVHQYLRPREDGQPKLKIFSNCIGMIKTIPRAQHPPLDSDKDPQDVMSFWDGADHLDALDELRYVLQTVREQVAVKPVGKMERIMAKLKKQKDGGFDYSYSNRYN
jgi:phage terminase large subunit